MFDQQHIEEIMGTKKVVVASSVTVGVAVCATVGGIVWHTRAANAAELSSLAVQWQTQSVQAAGAQDDLHVKVVDAQALLDAAKARGVDQALTDALAAAIDAANGFARVYGPLMDAHTVADARFENAAVADDLAGTLTAGANLDQAVKSVQGAIAALDAADLASSVAAYQDAVTVTQQAVTAAQGLINDTEGKVANDAAYATDFEPFVHGVVGQCAGVN
jgi:hypothetical protein